MRSVSKENYNPEENLLDKLNDLDIGFVKVSNDGIILNHNLTFNKIFGYDLEKNLIDTKTLDYWLNPEERNKFREILYKNGIVKKYVAPAKKADGEKIFLQINIKLNKNSNGEVISSEGAFVDVTECKKTATNISDLKIAEENLKESDERLKIFMESAPNTFMLYDSDLSLININEIGIKRFPAGTKKEDIIGKNIVELSPDIKKKGRYDEYMEVLKTGKPYFIEEFIPHPKFGKLHISLNAFKVLDGLGIIARDITEAKKAEEKIKESEEKYSTLAKLSPVGIFHTDQEGDCLYINERWSQIAGLTLDEALGTGWIEGLHPNDRKRVSAEWYAAAENNIPFESEYRFKRLDGRITWVYGQAIAIKDDLDKITGYVGTITDISERKLTEQKLKESEEKFRGFLDFGNIGMAITSVDKKWVYYNDQICKIFGFTREELQKKTWADLSYPEDLQSDVDQFSNILDSKIDSYQIEKRYIKKNGETIYAHLTISCIRNTDATVKHFLATLQDITERKKVEQKLIESEEIHRVFMETAKNFMHIIDNKGKIIYANRDFYGYKKEELMNMHITELMAEDTLPRFGLEMKNLIKNGSITLMDVYCKGKDGTKIIGELSVVAVYGTDGKFNGSRSIFKDITKRKKAEQKLRDSERNFRHLANELERILDHLPLIIAYKDDKNNLLRVNKYYADAHDLKKEDMEGKNAFDFYPKDQAQSYLDDDLEVINNRKPKLNYIEQWVSNKGNRWVNTSKIPYIDEEGEVKGVIAIVSDITDQKIAEEKLKDSEEKYRNLFQYSNDAIILHDIEENILDINQKAIEWFDYTRAEFLRFKISQLHPSEDLIIFQNALKDIKKDKFVNFEIHFTRKNGETFIADVSSKIIEIDGKTVIQGEIRDITERKRAEEKLKEISRLKSELLRRTSHELKTPLVSIKGFSDLLLELHDDQLDDYVLSTINEIKQGCIRLESLIGDILKTAELESGAIQVKKSKENLSFLIKYCVNELKGLYKLRNHKIDINIPFELIATFEKEQIHQLISNLLNNAIKYTPPKGQIEINYEIKNDYIIISIKDNGIGFTQQEHDRIFKQFGKIERFGQGYDVISEGSGLGLYISKKIIELHGGEIWMESEGRNKGTTFHFSIPIESKI